jgi:Uma2 family endonuclease
MMGEPTTSHQAVLVELLYRIRRYLEGKTCRVFPAPFGVRLFPIADASDDTVVEPDIAVICDSKKIDKRGCNGAPDLIIEILSPSNSRHDKVEKYRLYQEACVREYWIVDPEEKTVQVCVLENGRYVVAMYADNDVIPVAVLKGLHIHLEDIFAEENAAQ